MANLLLLEDDICLIDGVYHSLVKNNFQVDVARTVEEAKKYLLDIRKCCIGSTPKQVSRLVRREALRWCYFAIPVGEFIAIGIVWILCIVLRFLSPKLFGEMPVFSVSMPGIMAGIIVGVTTVLLAANAPAKRASGVSPLEAVSGNANNSEAVRKAVNIKVCKIETVLGINHATSSKRNLFLMTGSFAFSIILFLAFSVSVDFMNRSMPAVDLISYEQHQFNWAEDYLIGSKNAVDIVQQQALTALAVYDPKLAAQMQTDDTTIRLLMCS